MEMAKDAVLTRESSGAVKPAPAIRNTNFVAEAHNKHAVFCLLATSTGLVHTLMKNKDKPQTWARVATSNEWLELIPVNHEISRVIIAREPGNPNKGNLVFDSRSETLRSGVKVRCNGTIHPKVTIPINLC